MVLSKLCAAALAVAVTMPTTLAQFVTPPKDLITKKGYAGVNVRYKEVPTGICELNPHVKSYSGYADVAKDQHLFFWFFEARQVDPKTAPLTVWINGGPGSTSMYGLFQELGPCHLDFNGKPYNNPHSWSEVSNMIFIDQPVDVGFSYSKAVPGTIDWSSDEVTQLPSNHCPSNATAGTCGTFPSPDQSLTANSTANAAPNFWKAIQGFMGAFPQYSRDGFHFTTESYGGHYGPVFNEYFQEKNRNLPAGAKKIDLKSVSIGNGWYDPRVSYPAYYNFTVYPGNTYDYKPYNETFNKMFEKQMFGPGGCTEQLATCNKVGNNTQCNNADQYCANLESYLDDINRDEYDIRELMPDPFPSGDFTDYLNSIIVQRAVGAYTNFTNYSATVGDAFVTTGDDAREDCTVEDMQKLVNDGVYVVMYHGDADYNCNWLGGQVIAEHINAPGFNNAAGFRNITTSDKIVHGQVKQAGNFAFLRVYYSGHMVPFYQPLLSLEFFNRTLHGVDIAEGKTNVISNSKTNYYISKGTKYSTFREGNATMQYQILPADSTYNFTTGAPNPQ